MRQLGNYNKLIKLTCAKRKALVLSVNDLRLINLLECGAIPELQEVRNSHVLTLLFDNVHNDVRW